MAVEFQITMWIEDEHDEESPLDWKEVEHKLADLLSNEYDVLVTSFDYLENKIL